MCESINNIIFCSCMKDIPRNGILHNKNSRRNKVKIESEFIWTLYKFEGTNDITLDGFINFPVDYINDSLTSDVIILDLNSRNCFDFEYVPNEGDNLIIKNRNSNKYLSFIYKNELWTSNFYNGLVDKISKINFGIIELK